MPDFERRSRASFISSNDGGTPVSRTRWWMNIRSSYCFLVSMAHPQLAKFTLRTNPQHTNRSTLVLIRNQPYTEVRAGNPGRNSTFQQQDLDIVAHRGRGRVDRADNQRVGVRENLL